MKAITTIIIGLILLLGIQKSFSQNCLSLNKISKKQTQIECLGLSNSDNFAFKIDYFGELGLHPGLSLGIDYTLTQKKWATIHWDTELGGYWHRWNNTALFLKTSIGARLPIRSLFVDLNVGAGYMHTFAAGTIYQKAPEGGLEKARNWGHPHFMPTSSLLIGWDGTRKMNLPWTFHIGVETYLESSFNHIYLPHAAAKVGLTYKFKK